MGMEAKETTLGVISKTPSTSLDTGSLFGLELAKEDRLVGPRVSGILLSPPLQQ